MKIIDAQVHTWLSDRPSRPWMSTYRVDHRERPQMLVHAGGSMAPEHLVIEMAEAGVDAAILTPVGVYGTDNTLELGAVRRFPRKFSVMGWVDHMAEDMHRALAQGLADGMTGIRLLGLREQERHERREFDPVLRACERLDCPVAFSLSHPVPAGIKEVVQKFAGVRFVIDHLGVGYAPPLLGVFPPEPFEHLPEVLDFARFSNVSLKLTGAPALSAEPYPFRDVWPSSMRSWRRTASSVSCGEVTLPGPPG